MTVLGAALAFLVGVSLGLLGGGGSILTVPILVYVLHVPAKPAIAMSLGVVGMTAAIGAIQHWRRGNIALPVVAMFAPLAMVGAFFGSRIAKLLSGTVQLTLFGIVVLIAAMSMLRNSFRDAGASPSGETAVRTDRRTMVILAVSGLGVGVLTAVIGVGGGFLIVPPLVLVAGLPMRMAIGTSLVVITLNALSGFAGYLGREVIDWQMVWIFTAIAAAGTFVGTWAAHHAPQQQLKRGFAVFLVAVGIFVLYHR